MVAVVVGAPLALEIPTVLNVMMEAIIQVGLGGACQHILNAILGHSNCFIAILM
jgi:hypothetical protein